MYAAAVEVGFMEDRYRGERVLVFDRALLDELGSFNGFSRDAERYLGVILDKRNNRFCERFRAETDETLKQIIPYVVFVHNDLVFSYVRGKQAGESRLVGNRSVGVGGHINPADDVLFSGAEVASDRTAYIEAVRREIAEEVVVDGPFEPRIAALLNDDSNPVGRVHFGVIHVCELDHTAVRKREQQITQSGFVPIAELTGPRREELETWSAFAVDLLIERGRA
jgi:predicted NUDIX family phosphoesterase